MPQRFRPEHLQGLLERSVSNKSQLVNAICYDLDFRNCELGLLFQVSFVRHDQYGAAENSLHEKTEKLSRIQFMIMTLFSDHRVIF